MKRKASALITAFALVFSIIWNPALSFAVTDVVSSSSADSAQVQSNTDETQTQSAQSSNDNSTQGNNVQTNSVQSQSTSASAQSQQGMEISDPAQADSDEGLTDNKNQSQSNMNSWRYQNGELVVSNENSDSDDENNASNMLRSVGESPTACGIDVSEHQGKIDWDVVKNSGEVDFAILRVGYGDDFTSQDDAWWAYNVSECERLGIPYGVYIYSYATSYSQINSEVAHTKRLLSGHNPSYPVYIDMEDNSTKSLGQSTLTKFAKSFCQQISSAGYTAGVYANLYWWNTYLNSSELDSYDRWVAQYNYQCDYDGDYRLWQYCDDGKVKGISGYVDMNYDYGESAAVLDLFEMPASAYEKTLDDGEYYIKTALNNSSVLDITGASKSDGANLQLYESNKSQAQRFTVMRDDSSGYYKIVNVNSGKALGLAGARNGYKSNVAQYTVNKRDNSQKWIIESNSDGTFTIRSAVNTNYVLDVASASTSNGTNVQLYVSNGTNAQKYKFSFTSVDVAGGDEIEEGLYTFSSKLDSSKVLDITNGSTESGALLQLYVSNGTKAQKFMIQKANGYDGFYYIINVNSDMALEVKNGGLTSGANIQQNKLSEGADEQLWAPRKNSDGSYSFISKVSGKVMDITSANTANGTKVQIWESNDSDAQKFSLKKTSFDSIIADGVYTIQSSSNSSYGLDVAGGSTSNGGNVQLYKLNETPAQTFKVSFDEDSGYYIIENLKSGKMLDVTSGVARNGANIQQYVSNGTLAQRWVISENSDGSYTIKSAINRNYVLDIASGNISNGSNVQLYTSNGTAAQKFSFKSAVKLKSVEEGTYAFKSGINPSYVMDIAGGSSANGANVQLYISNNTGAQKFKVSYDSSTGYYTITNVQSGKVLDATSGASSNGTNIQQYAGNNTFAQKWIIEEKSNGRYVIKSALNPAVVVDVAAGNASNGSNIQLYESNGTNAQRFVLEQV